MATLPDLVSVLSLVDGRSSEAILNVARLLRAAGLLSTGKRGGGAAEMSFADAAHLLIAINSSDASVEAPTATAFMMALAPSGIPRQDLPQPLVNIEAGKTFGEALAALIENVPELVSVIAEALERRYGAPDYSPAQRALLLEHIVIGGGPLALRVVMKRTAARLVLEWRDSAPQIDWERRFYFIPGQTQPPERAMPGDRRVSVEVGFPTVIALFECVAGQKIHAFSDRELT